MYIKSENLQAQQSKHMITDALLTLMKAYPFDDITITQICQEAKVVRQTFYRNFESKIDILEFYLDNMFEKYISDYYSSETELYCLLKRFFDYMSLQKYFLILIEKNNLFFLLNKTMTINITKFSLVPIIMETHNEQKHDIYILGFIASTICSILSLWVKNNFEESTEMLANLATTFLSGLEKAMNFENEL
jgi:AcrR family transcriptional regulator